MMKRVEFKKKYIYMESSLEQMPKIKFFLNFIFPFIQREEETKRKEKKIQIR